MDKKLDLFMLHLSEFPEQLRIMSLILLYTGINKGKMFLLRNVDFYYENEDSWMKVLGTNRSVPIPDIPHLHKNEQVRSLLNEEKEKQGQGTFAQLKREVRDKSLEKQVELYQREIKRLLDENEKLKKENRKLVRALNKLQKDVK